MSHWALEEQADISHTHSRTNLMMMIFPCTVLSTCEIQVLSLFSWSTSSTLSRIWAKVSSTISPLFLSLQDNLASVDTSNKRQSWYLNLGWSYVRDFVFPLMSFPLVRNPVVSNWCKRIELKFSCKHSKLCISASILHLFQTFLPIGGNMYEPHTCFTHSLPLYMYSLCLKYPS